MEDNEAESIFSALAHEGRLSLFRRLAERGEVGESSGELADALGLNPTTASAQLLILANAGLVKSRRVGRRVNYQAISKTMENLMRYLRQNCCAPGCCGCCAGKETESE